MKIKTKITAVVCIAIFLTVSLIGVSMYIYVKPIFSKQIITDNSTIVSKVTQQVSYSMEDIVRYAKGIALNEEVQMRLKNINMMSGYDFFYNEFKLNTTLKEFALLRDNIIVDIFAVDPEHNSLDLNGMYRNSLHGDWYVPFKDNPDLNGFSKPHYVSAHLNSPENKVISYVVNIYDKNNPTIYLGKQIIFINYDVLMKPLVIRDTQDVEIAAFDKFGNVIYALDDDWHADSLEQMKEWLPADEVTFNNEHYYFTEDITFAGWRMIGVLSKDKIDASMKYFNYMLLAIHLICLLIMLLIIYPVEASVTKPLIQLIRGMRKVSKGQLDTQIQVTSGDEIEEVAYIFNKMVKDVKTLIEASVLAEKKQRNLALQMFMYQINPHFVYNTLNSIIYLARKADAPQIAELTKTFISFLQRTIRNQPEMFSSIQNEMVYIDDYCQILQYRYNDRLEVYWEVDESIRHYQIPQMILYPLVENSIFHGLLPASRKGWIRIKITLEEPFLRICVEDNGMGIAPQNVEQLRSQLSKSSIDEGEVADHIGMLNVNNRLKLLFGADFELQIESIEDENTRVEFAIPATISRDTKIV